MILDTTCFTLEIIGTTQLHVVAGAVIAVVFGGWGWLLGFNACHRAYRKGMKLSAEVSSRFK